MSQALTQQDMRMQNHERLGHASFKRIRQIEAKTLAKLRHPRRSEKLKDYLDAS